MSQTARFQETLRRLVLFDEGFVNAGFGLDRAEASALDAKTAALLQVAVSVAIGSSAVCLQWGAARALARRDQGRDHRRAPGDRPGGWPRPGRLSSSRVAAALEYDIEAALEEPNHR
jgi:hypothetical protein